MGCCLLAAMTVGLVSNSGGLFQPYIADELGIPRARVALVQTIQSLSAVAGLMVANRLIDKLNLRVIMSACVLLVGASFMLNALFSSIYPYYITFACIGFANPFLFGLVGPTMLTNWFRQRLGTVMGIAASMTGIGGAIFNPLIAWGIDRFGWRATYVAVGIAFVIVLLPLTVFVIKLKPGEGQQPYGYIPDDAVIDKSDHGISAARARRMPSFYLYIAAMAFLAVPGGFMQQLSPHVVTLGHPIATGATVMSGVMLGIAGGKIMIGWLLDRFRAPVVMISFGVIGMLGWLGITFFSVPILLIACGFLAGSAHAISQVGIPLGVRQTFGPMDYRRIYATVTAAMSLMAAVMPTLGSAFYDMTGTYRTPLIITAFSYTAAIPCVLLARKLGSVQTVSEE